MNVRSDLRAGNDLTECHRQRDEWKKQAGLMQAFAVTGQRPAGLRLVPPSTSLPFSPLPAPAPGTQQKTGIVDHSGFCG